jgi:hypothetical protein
LRYLCAVSEFEAGNNWRNEIGEAHRIIISHIE